MQCNAIHMFNSIFLNKLIFKKNDPLDCFQSSQDHVLALSENKEKKRKEKEKNNRSSVNSAAS